MTPVLGWSMASWQFRAGCSRRRCLIRSLVSCRRARRRRRRVGWVKRWEGARGNVSSLKRLETCALTSFAHLIHLRSSHAPSSLLAESLVADPSDCPSPTRHHRRRPPTRSLRTFRTSPRPLALPTLQSPTNPDRRHHPRRRFRRLGIPLHAGASRVWGADQGHCSAQ